MPDKGYEVKMNGSQTARLIEYRRRRDILIGKHEKALASGDGPKKDGEDKPAADAETPTVGEPEGAVTEGKPTVESDATPAAPEEKNSAGDSPNAAEKSETKEDAVPVDLSTSLSKVDPQLQKAVDYLSTELARGPEQSTQ
jgi:hypothetical protein